MHGLWLLAVAQGLLPTGVARARAPPQVQGRTRLLRMERGDDDPDPRGPSIETSRSDAPLSDSSQRMDAPSVAQDKEEAFGPSATADELADYLPDWAREMTLDPEAREAYERDVGRTRSSLRRSVKADGRTWEDDGDFGFAEFNVLELAEDHDVPVEAVLETLASSGVALGKLRESLREPVKNFGTDVQLQELIAFMLGVDKIELADQYLDESVAEIAEETSLTPAQVLAMCQDLGYPMLTEDARIKKGDWDLLQRRIEDAAPTR